MARFSNDDGTLLTLGAVLVLSVGGLAARGSRAMYPPWRPGFEADPHTTFGRGESYVSPKEAALESAKRWMKAHGGEYDKHRQQLDVDRGEDVADGAWTNQNQWDRDKALSAENDEDQEDLWNEAMGLLPPKGEPWGWTPLLT